MISNTERLDNFEFAYKQIIHDDFFRVCDENGCCGITNGSITITSNRFNIKKLSKRFRFKKIMIRKEFYYDELSKDTYSFFSQNRLRYMSLVSELHTLIERSLTYKFDQPIKL